MHDNRELLRSLRAATTSRASALQAARAQLQKRRARLHSGCSVLVEACERLKVGRALLGNSVCCASMPMRMCL